MKNKLKYLWLSIFALNVLIVLIESLIPGKASANQSNHVTDKVIDIIDVIKPDETLDYIYPSEIKINTIESISLGSIETLDLSFFPKNTNYKKVIWKSNNDEIASINSGGKIKAKKEGTTTISVYSEYNQNICDQIVIEVVKPKHIPCEDIEIIGDSNLYIHDEKSTSSRLEIKKTPTNAAVDLIEWKSLNPDILTVSDKGIVKALKVGTGSIQAKVISGGIEITKVISFNIQQMEVAKLESIQIIGEEFCYINRNIKFNVNFFTEQKIDNHIYFDSTVSWSVDKQSVATIDQNGVLTGKTAGSVKVKVVSEFDSNIFAELDIIIKPVLIESVTLNVDKSKIKIGEIIQLKYSIFPLDATDQTIVFESSNDNILIDNTGEVIAMKKGNATIYIKNINGEILNEINLEVENKMLFSEQDLQKLRYFVRKSVGHFGAFFTMSIFGFLTCYSFFKKRNLSFIIYLSVGILVSITSELFQKITIGRYCTVDDMIINSSGYLTASMLILLVSLLIQIIKKLN